MTRWLLLALSMVALFAPPISLAQAEEKKYSAYNFPSLTLDAEGNPDFSKLEWVANDKEEGNSTPLCQAVFAELKKGDDVRVNLPDFPRTPKTQSGLARIHWKNLDPQANFSTVMDILSYRFKNNDYEVNGEVPTTTDGMEQLKSSDVLDTYKYYARNGFLVLQESIFDVDGDGIKDRALRMGYRMAKSSSSTKDGHIAVRYNAGDVPTFQYMVFFRDAKGREIRSGFDIDDGSIGEYYKSRSIGVFTYQGRVFYFQMGNVLNVFSVSKREGASINFSYPLCDFYIASEEGEQK